MNIIAWIVLGLLAGAIAKAIYPGYQGGGILSTMILGIIGAFVGGTVFTLIRTGTLQITAAGAGLSIPGLLVAIIGAMIAIYLWGLLRRSSNA
ncbi:GlsB/YeaQ/YmgE family stress response membrane protein [Cylindrospermum sp. FACHB-282]|uniref:GlsB/YeaQ/YmgE family stress response membrane protein n=1 Tax=Cylindrospermum sp. FACHB-282 TaxID=2692794 RepID=UPI0016876D0A|nr:GlsB/YeaQ/YmgE family stress response membrane protein [Cylindrospermum sp. FACHB-282]MBD2383896.1 GlsB/YeaQ/YmgE family stress response membrane protein [Cylindrospermum sp. FACHB-282]